MDHKLLDIDLKLIDDGAGILEGYASTFANWDSVRERPAKGAFSAHLADFLRDGFIAVGHDWSALPIATPVDAREDEHGLFVRGEFHSTQAAQDARTVTKERLARGKSVKLSIGYEVLADDYTPDGRVLKDIKLYEWSIVTVPANPQAALTYAKQGRTIDQEHRAALTAVDDYITRLTSLAALRAKEGRVLSGDNRERIKGAIDTLDGALTALRDLLAATEPQPTGDTAKEALRLFAEFHSLEARLHGAMT